jgi:K+-sensing histidine kinase KdpD
MRSPKALSVLDTAIGTLLCASLALILALLFNQTRLEVVLPLVSLTVVVAVAARFGVATGVLGSIASALLLAYFVYAPEHSFRIVSHDARANISWLLIGGIVLSFFLTPRREVATKNNRHSRGADE